MTKRKFFGFETTPEKFVSAVITSLDETLKAHAGKSSAVQRGRPRKMAQLVVYCEFIDLLKASHEEGEAHRELARRYGCKTRIICNAIAAIDSMLAGMHPMYTKDLPESERAEASAKMRRAARVADNLPATLNEGAIAHPIMQKRAEAYRRRKRKGE